MEIRISGKIASLTEIRFRQHPSYYQFAMDTLLSGALVTGPATGSTRLSKSGTAVLGQRRYQNSRFAFIVGSDSIEIMATLTIRQLDERTKARLRIRAAHHGRSMEEEAREILRLTLTAVPPARRNLAEAIRHRFAVLGGVELKLPPRGAVREPPEFA
jgi:plasmid stability protein